MIDYYGSDADYIHIKFGRMHKMYNFTTEFRAKYPNFCAEYEKYWEQDKTCRFHNPLEIAQYVDMFEVPVHFYYNYTDTPSKSMADVYEYLIREYTGISNEVDGSFRKDYNKSLDGQEPVDKDYQVKPIRHITVEFK